MASLLTVGDVAVGAYLGMDREPAMPTADRWEVGYREGSWGFIALVTLLRSSQCRDIRKAVSGEERMFWKRHFCSCTFTFTFTSRNSVCVSL